MSTSRKITKRARWARKDYYQAALDDPWYKLLLSMQDNVLRATVRFWKRRHVAGPTLPVMTANVSSPIERGSDSTSISVCVGGVKIYLADSLQFLLEYCCRLNPNGCFSFMPSHRGERPDDMHLSQFYNSEVEICGKFEDVILLAERYLRCLCRAVFEGCDELARQIIGDLSHVRRLALSQTRLPRLTVDDAVSILPRRYLTNKRTGGIRRITREGERELIRQFGGVIWLTHPDHRSVPFYQAFGDESCRTAKAADLLLGRGELIGLGERHAEVEPLLRSLEMHGLRLKAKEYEWYIEMRRKFPMTTAGFGLGVERFLCWVMRHTDVRDCQLFQRFRGKRFVV